MFFSCCGRQDRIGNESIRYEGPEKLLQISTSKESNLSCGIGIAFKPDSKGILTVKRLIAGGSAELSGAVQVISSFAFLPFVHLSNCITGGRLFTFSGQQSH
jgi:hypothetical protein